MAELWEQTWQILRLEVAPALAASLVMMLIVRLLGGERLSPLATALAVAAGLVAGNHFRGLMAELAFNHHPTLQELRPVLGQVLEPKPPNADDEPDKTGNAEPTPTLPRLPQRHYWLPWLAGLAVLVELLVRLPGMPAGLGWAVRAFVAMFVARLLTPDPYRLKFPESTWLLGGAILLEWAILTTLVRQWKDSTVAAALTLCFAAASLVILLQTSGPSLAEMTVLCFAALLGPALVAWKWPSDTSPAIAAATVILSPLLLLAHNAADPARPPRNFLLIGLAPLALTPMLLPFLIRQTGWKRWLLGVILPLIPIGLAMFWVLQETPLSSLLPAPAAAN